MRYCVPPGCPPAAPAQRACASGVPVQALKAVKECVEDPSRMEQYRGDPTLYGMLKKVLSRG